MTTESVFRSDERRAPRRRDVLWEQLRVIGYTLRIPMLLMVALGVPFTVFLAFQIVNGDMAANIHARPSPLPGVIGALLPIALWAREERFGAGFLWTLPVDRRQHALIKALAGWLWLMAGLVLYALGQLVLVLVSGGQVLPVETLHVLTVADFTRESLDPAVLRTVRWAPGPLIWAVPFAAATATYLLASAIMLGMRYPLRWVIGAVLLVPLSSVASAAASRVTGAEWLSEAPMRAASLFLEGAYGLTSLLNLRIWSLDRRAILASGERVHVWAAVPEISDWGIAALLWIGAGLLALWIAASRHREQRRS